LGIEAGYHAGVRPTVRGWLVLLALALAACPAPRPTIESAAARADRGEWRAALADYDAIVQARATQAGDRVRAWTAGALVCERLRDAGGARRRLEAAVAADVAGQSEPAMYHLADLLRDEDRARALNLYYRAAAGAEKHRSGGFPYRAAMDRILQLSMTR
jgi:hypothetical protein